MSTAYVLENKKESERLEKQAKLAAYQLSEEFSNFLVKPGQRVLDAGCGTGLVARYLAEHFPKSIIEGCDRSVDRIEHSTATETNVQRTPIQYFISNLESIQQKNETYDAITCRYVVEHVDSPLKVFQEFHRVLKPSGQVQIVDFDGLLYNLHPLSDELADMLTTLKTKAPFDLFVGRKIPHYLQQAGFKDCKWEITVHDFKGEELLGEFQMYLERLTFAIPLLSQIFGSETKAHRMKKIFLEEMMQPNSTLFYNKFVVTGVK
jgi:ubiquinone/menaquinone biosynthesis C-methylase UbiE